LARPTKFKEEYKEQCRKMAGYGLIDDQMSDILGVTKQTFNNWKKSHKEFFDSLKEGKLYADNIIVKSLYNRAEGYKHPETKVFCNNGEIVTKEITKHYPPSVPACETWLYNRMPKEWKRNAEIGDDGTSKIDGLKISFVDENDNPINPKFEMTKSAED